MLRFGIVTQVDYQRVMVRVHFSDIGLLSPWLHVPQRNVARNQDYALPDVGEQVVVLLDEFGDRGVVLGATYRGDHQPPEEAGEGIRLVRFEDGTTVRYDRAEHRLTVEVTGDADIAVEGDALVDVGGDITMQAGGDIDIEAGGNVNIRGTQVHLN